MRFITCILACFGFFVVNGYEIDPLIYLHKYGYARPGRSSAHSLKASIMKLQRFFHLPVTGKMDDATKAVMQKPRCGVPDIEVSKPQFKVRRVRRYAESKYYWRNRKLTYHFENYSPDLGERKTREVIERAFAMWNKAAKIYFEEKKSGTADIMIRFEGGKHNCKDPFDGQGGVLAHAYYPEIGDAHFDEAEDFTDGTYNGTNLFFVAAHEFGHSLGLPHSDVYGSLMYPTYDGYRPNFQLPADDTGAIQALYGCKEEQKPISYPAAASSAEGILYEHWNALQGNKIQDLDPLTCKYPHSPDAVAIMPSSEFDRNNGKNTGGRLRGYFTPDLTGYHKFYLMTSKQGQFWISHNESPAGKTKLIQKNYRSLDQLTEDLPSSGLVYLKEGQPYYIEGVQSSRYQESFFKIAVKEPGSKEIKVMTKENLQWMLTDRDIRVMMCNGRYEPLHCPNEYQIEIVKAAYGRNRDQEQYIHELCSQSRDIWQYKECAAESSLLTTKEMCEGKQICLLHASRDIYGAECGHRFHHVLDVTYRCVKKLGLKPQTTEKPTVAPGVCQDHPDYAMYCQYYKEDGRCEKYAMLYRKRCPATCGFCKGGPAPICVDDYTTGAALKCPRWKEEGFCTLPREIDNMKKYCRKTCGFCT